MILSGILAGAIGVFVKLIDNKIPIMSLVFYRMFLALIFLLIFVPTLDKKWYKVKKKDLMHYFIAGLLLAVTLSLFTVANLFAPVQNVVLITNFAPFLVLIWASLFLKEKITKIKVVTLLIAVVGIVILNPFRAGEQMLGNTLALIQAFSYSIMLVWFRRENTEHKIGAVIWFFFFSALLLLPFFLYFGLGDLSGNVIWYVLFLGILSTGLAYLLQNIAFEDMEAEVSSIVIMISMPLTGVLLAMIVLGEMLNLRVIVGGAILIIAGVYLQYHSKRVRASIRKIFHLGV